MALTYKLADHQEISTGVLIMARIIVVLLILTYFDASFATCEEEIPFCNDRLKELVKDEEDWSKRCLKYEGHKIDSSCCETEKEYLRKRMCMLSKLCFYKGLRSEPYILIRSRFALTAIDLKTLNRTAVISGLGDGAMDIDTVEKKLYFQDGNSISTFNPNDEEICVEVFAKNTTASDMAIDLKGRRMFWTEHIEKRISRANLNGKERSVLVKTTGKPYGIALDPWRRYVLWTEPYEGLVQRVNLATRKIVAVVRSSLSFAIACTAGRVYWLHVERKSDATHILSVDYDGLMKEKIANGSFNRHLLGVFENLMYVFDNNSTSLHEMNVVNGKVSRKILVRDDLYYSLTIVDSCLQQEFVPNGEIAYWLDQTTDVTWNTVSNASYTVTACCSIKGEGHHGCLNVDECPSFTRLHECHNGPKKSTRTCVISHSTPIGITVHVTLSINVPGCPTNSTILSLYIAWQVIRPKPLHGLSLKLLSDGMLAKWSHKKAGNGLSLCYFYKAVEVFNKEVSVIEQGEIHTQSVKVYLSQDIRHGYRQIKFCVKLRYCRNNIYGKMSEETCESKRTLPGAPSRSVKMSCDGDRGVNPCPVVKNESERNIILLWELPEKRFWNGILTKIEIIINNTVYTTINATRKNYTLTGLLLDEDYHIQLKLFSHSGEGRTTLPMPFSKEKVASPGSDISEDEVDSALLITVVTAALVVAITVALVFTCLRISSKRKQKSPLPNIGLELPRQGSAHSGTDPNLRTNPANYESLPTSVVGLGGKSFVEKLSCNSSENNSNTCPVAANTPTGTCRNDATYNPKETGIY